jgi:hypothetical protein
MRTGAMSELPQPDIAWLERFFDVRQSRQWKILERGSLFDIPRDPQAGFASSLWELETLDRRCFVLEHL